MAAELTAVHKQYMVVCKGKLKTLLATAEGCQWPMDEWLLLLSREA